MKEVAKRFYQKIETVVSLEEILGAAERDVIKALQPIVKKYFEPVSNLAEIVSDYKKLSSYYSFLVMKSGFYESKSIVLEEEKSRKRMQVFIDLKGRQKNPDEGVYGTEKTLEYISKLAVKEHTKVITNNNAAARLLSKVAEGVQALTIALSVNIRGLEGEKFHRRD